MLQESVGPRRAPRPPPEAFHLRTPSRRDRSVHAALGVRRGVTLVELLVVLVLMAISAALVVPALRPRSGDALRDGDGQPMSPVDAVLTEARRLAIKRGEPMHLRVTSDGVWAVAPLAGGDAIRDGRLPTALGWVPDVVIDAMGVCALASGTVAPQFATAWDALQCRWRSGPTVTQSRGPTGMPA
jgi:prepilin-type N-terminal cleavage/methylation domain-containing protein